MFSKLHTHKNRAISFLGEWHTHPESNPIPSPLDKKEWQQIKKHNTEPLIFCILGTESTYFSVYK
ncbi:Mov34/MPN/PAD-1 family protein [uncultured Treponema sp.]|uniref:Mov34/MPN/PAD-1 family protein n=1 Tax=uncultured Treponema sp. TaxID=162155 RepID=UPI00345D0CAC